MTFTPVDRLPERVPILPRKRNADHLKEFLKMGVKYAKVDFGPLEYINMQTAHAATCRLADYYGLPIKSTIINNELHLINLELEEPHNENT